MEGIPSRNWPMWARQSYGLVAYMKVVSNCSSISRETSFVP